MFSSKERKGRKTSTTTTPECSHIAATGFVHFVSHKMSECSLLVLSVLNCNKSIRGAFYPACSRATTQVELKLYCCEFTEYPNLVTTDEIT